MAQARPRSVAPVEEITPMEWVYERAGFRVSELDFTISDCEKLDEMTGLTHSVSYPTANPKTMRCWLQVAFAAAGMDDPEGKAKKVTWRQALAGFKQVPVNLPEMEMLEDDGSIPFVEGQSSTAS